MSGPTWLPPVRRRDRIAVAATVLAGAIFTGFALAPHLPVVLWNATASAPLGFYSLTSGALPQVGEWVALKPPPRLADWLAGAGYLPPHVPLLKKVAAAGGQQICRRGDRILIDGVAVARVRLRDRRGRVLPSWAGCRRLEADEILLLNAPPDSLDGRYFGPSRSQDVLGRAEPLWTWGAPQ
jgi:conjugative transfer signal peptidase TraF